MIYGMCKYTPVELFEGFGQSYQRLESVMDYFPSADAAGHPNLCGFGKGILETVLNSDEIDQVVLVNCCDVVRRVYEIVQREKPMKFLFLLDLPHKNGPAEQKRYVFEMKKLIAAYEAYSGKRFNCYKAYQALLSQQDAALTCENREGCEAQEEGASLSARPYISLQGAHSGLHLPAMIRGHFTVPVKDDTCSGNRLLEGPFHEPEDLNDFLEEYAKALLGQMPCMRMTNVEERQTLSPDAAGVIYHTMKFCDYYGFEYASVRGEASRPVLKIETDGTQQSEGQLSTRLEAFAESLHLNARRQTKTRTGRYVAGIDSGSASTDVVIMNEDRQIVSYSVLRTGIGAALGAEKALEEALKKAGLQRDQIGAVTATGYGRDTIGLGDESVTEITCHARGAHFLEPSVRTIVDIGGQDSKVICVDENGAVLNFAMNDKCAAGTGRFLEMMARTMELSMEQMTRLGLAWKNEVPISSMCTVFAESEVVSLIAQNTAAPDIIHGLNQSVANKVAALAKRVQGRPVYMMTGGVALNQGVVECLEKKLGEKIVVSPYAQICGAIGAALFSLDTNER